MARKMVLRIQSPSGRFVVDGLTPNSTLWNLQKILEDKTSVEPDLQRILCGYPPKELSGYNPLLTLESLKIKSGDTLTLEELESKRERQVDFRDTVTRTSITKQPQPTTSRTVDDRINRDTLTNERHEKMDTDDVVAVRSLQNSASGTKRCSDSTGSSVSSKKRSGKLARKVVPADNSCLFKSISILLCNNADTSKELRELAAGIIISNPDRFSTVLLGKTNSEYTQWLLRQESWGGAIELTVFSEHFKVELDVVDIQSQRVDRFGEGKYFDRRALLLYDGIHYDPLVIVDNDETILQTTFPVSNEAVMFEAIDIASQAYQAHQYTDIAKFSLRCLVCGTALTGHSDAQTHAQRTGHINFGEV